MEIVREIVETALLTGRVSGEDPVGLLLIAEPEHGKTSIVLERSFSSAVDVTDATGRGIQELLKYKPEISHLIFNDLTAIMAHGKTVKAYTISMINAMTEEGIRSVAFPGDIQVFENGKRGLIACVTPPMIRDGRAWWNKIGLTTRLVPFFFRHGSELVLKVKEAIDHEIRYAKPGAFALPKVPIKVPIQEPHLTAIRKMADQKAKELGDNTGYRRLKQFRRLAKAHALRRSWKKPMVTFEDTKFLRSIMPFISYRTAHPL